MKIFYSHVVNFLKFETHREKIVRFNDALKFTSSFFVECVNPIIFKKRTLVRRRRMMMVLAQFTSMQPLLRNSNGTKIIILPK